MPRLVRIYIIDVITGFGLAALFTGFLLWLDVANLWHLVSSVKGGWIGAVMLFVFNGIVFAGVQFGITVMGLADDGKGGGKRAGAASGLAPARAVASPPKGKGKDVPTHRCWDR